MNELRAKAGVKQKIPTPTFPKNLKLVYMSDSMAGDSVYSDDEKFVTNISCTFQKLLVSIILK